MKNPENWFSARAPRGFGFGLCVIRARQGTDVVGNGIFEKHATLERDVALRSRECIVVDSLRGELMDPHCVIGQVGSDINNELWTRDGTIPSARELFWCQKVRRHIDD